MCGIISILTNNNNIDIQSILINGLYQLQNRGYDSAGIGFISEKNKCNKICFN